MTNQTFCPKCGQAITENVKFCPACGAALSAGSQSIQQPKPKSKPKLPIVFGALALISGILYFVSYNAVVGKSFSYVMSKANGDTASVLYQDIMGVMLTVTPFVFFLFLALTIIFLVLRLKNRKK
jgi:uncharacterized membrane protein YvbJ